MNTLHNGPSTTEKVTMQRQTLSNVAALAALSVVGGAAEASAQTHYYPIVSGDTEAYIGYVQKPGTNNYRPWVCYDGPGSNNAIWVALGSYGSPNLNGNYIVHLDNASGDSGGDSVIIFDRVAGWDTGDHVDGDCEEDEDAFYGWRAIDYNGYYLDVYGGPGNDTINIELDAYDADTIVRGELGDDSIAIAYCPTYSAADGGWGDDNIIGGYGDCENLWGDLDDDCLRDLNSLHGQYICGSGTDQWNGYDTPNPYYHACEGSGGTPLCGWPF